MIRWDEYMLGLLVVGFGTFGWLLWGNALAGSVARAIGDWQRRRR